MWRRVALVALSLGLICLYRTALVIAFGYASAVVMPRWWRDALGHTHAAYWAWALTIDTLVTVAVSTPFALLFARAYRRRWLLLSLLAAGFAVAADVAAVPTILADLPHAAALTFYIQTLTTNTVRVLLVLPLLTWAAWQLSCHPRLERP